MGKGNSSLIRAGDVQFIRFLFSRHRLPGTHERAATTAYPAFENQFKVQKTESCSQHMNFCCFTPNLGDQHWGLLVFQLLPGPCPAKRKMSYTPRLDSPGSGLPGAYSKTQVGENNNNRPSLFNGIKIRRENLQQQPQNDESLLHLATKLIQYLKPSLLPWDQKGRTVMGL